MIRRNSCTIIGPKRKYCDFIAFLRVGDLVHEEILETPNFQVFLEFIISLSKYYNDVAAHQPTELKYLI